MSNPEKRKRGRPPLPAAVRAQRLAARSEKYTNISVSKDVRAALNAYRDELSEVLGVDLTLTQALKYMINNSVVSGGKR